MLKQGVILLLLVAAVSFGCNKTGTMLSGESGVASTQQPKSFSIPTIDPKTKAVADYILDKNNRNKFLAHTQLGTDAVEVKFAEGQKSYTILCSTQNAPLPFLSFWVWEKNVRGEDVMSNFSDRGWDGVCDFGSNAFEGAQKKLFNFVAGEEGAQHQQYWQAVLESTIEATMKHFGIRVPINKEAII